MAEQTLDPLRDRRVVTALAALAGITLALHLYAYRHLHHDDAYITFRYARNIAQGEGFVFNPGERRLATSSPLFTLLMAIPHGLGIDVRWSALVSSAVALRATAASLFIILRRDHPWLAASVFALACVGGLGCLDFALLETLTAGGLTVGAMASFHERRHLLTGALLGLAFLTRYDTVVLVPLLATMHWLRDRRVPARPLGMAFVVVTPWLVFATAYFGDPVPKTLAAKALLTPFGVYLDHYLHLIYRLPGLAVPWPVGLALSAAGLALFVRERNLTAIVLVLHGALHLLLYAAIGPPATQHWHNYLPMLSLRVAMVAGVLGWLEVLLRARRHIPAAAAVTATLSAVMAFHVGARARTVRDAFWLGQRHARYEAVADYVDQHFPPRGRFMAAEVGTLGYLTDRPMVGVWGLVAPTNAYPRTQSLGDFIALVKVYQPELLLMDNPEMAHLVARDTGAYEVVHVFPWKVWSSTLLVRRRPPTRRGPP